jgi:hypothetical protein
MIAAGVPEKNVVRASNAAVAEAVVPPPVYPQALSTMAYN